MKIITSSVFYPIILIDQAPAPTPVDLYTYDLKLYNMRSWRVAAKIQTRPTLLPSSLELGERLLVRVACRSS